MRRTRHFAGVIGAAGIVVSPFMMATVAQADDTLPPDTVDGVVGNANPGGVDESVGDDVPNLPVTRVVGKAASLDVMVVDGNPVALDLPDEVVKSLPEPGTVLTKDEANELQDALKPHVVEGDLELVANSDIGFYGHDSVEGAAWAVEDEATNPGDDVNGTVEDGTKSEEQVAPVADNAGAVEPRGVVSAPRVVAASNTVGVAAPPAANVVPDVVEDAADDAAVGLSETPQLPVTGEDQTARTALPAAEDGGLPLAPLLGITGLVLGGGIGVVTLRKKLDLADSK